jgi:hypothetical protein
MYESKTTMNEDLSVGSMLIIGSTKPSTLNHLGLRC